MDGDKEGGKGDVVKERGRGEDMGRWGDEGSGRKGM